MPIKQKNIFLSSFFSFFCPEEKNEAFKYLSLLALVFFISFNYTILKALKDPLIITAQNSSALVLAFLKTWAVLPSAFVAATSFTWLCNRYSFRRTFYILTSFFLIYFILFTSFLYPYREALYWGDPNLLSLKQSSSGWLNYSNFLRTFLTLLYYWPISSFYVMAELWSSLVLSVLFWGFANQITPLNEAKKFYGLINLIGNVSGLLAGIISYYFNIFSTDNCFFKACSAWDHTVYSLMSLTIIASVLILIIFHFSYLKFSKSPGYVKHSTQKIQKKKKMGMKEAFSKCFHSKYIFSIAIIVLAYNLSMNILEILWKDQTRILYPKTADYHSYTTQITMLIGVFSTLFGLLVSFVLRFFSWKKTAYFTPLLLSFTALLFFGSIFLNDLGWNFIFPILGLSPLGLIVFIGGIQNSLCRSAKFTFFDTTKEIAFIPLSKDDKIKAKAVIDGFGSRLGKSGGAVIVQIMVFFVPTVSAMAPYFLIILLPMISGWFYAIKHIGHVFEKYESGLKPEDTL